jgi:murein DD-endopeptidase MepM/ murein hydrolase activator NlpD
MAEAAGALVAVIFVALSTACGGDSPPATEAPSATSVASAEPRVTSTRVVEPSITPQAADPGLPLGFPLDPLQATDEVVGSSGARTFKAGGGPTVGGYSRDDQPSADPVVANRAGWNCRVHFEYEATPAVDWYVPAGTPVFATMDGTAILFINTYVNGFDYYAVPREPYIGDPDRARAFVNPFPGPGGGMGVYVSVISERHRTDYGHLNLDATVANVPQGAFIAPYGADYAYRPQFGVPGPSSADDELASWPVKRGDVIGYTGDAGYSEAPHLHYQIIRRADGAQLCPTSEAGFDDGGWLFRES